MSEVTVHFYESWFHRAAGFPELLPYNYIEADPAAPRKAYAENSEQAHEIECYRENLKRLLHVVTYLWTEKRGIHFSYQVHLEEPSEVAWTCDNEELSDLIEQLGTDAEFIGGPELNMYSETFDPFYLVLKAAE